MYARALTAEFIGSFVWVLAVCGASATATPAGDPALAAAGIIGCAVMAATYAVGHISGGHFNPAVTLGLVAGGRFEMGDAVGYIVAQVSGAVAAATVFFLIGFGSPDDSSASATLANVANTFGGANEYSALSAITIEVVIAVLYVSIFIGATSRGAPAGFAPIAIGMALVAFHVIAAPITNAALNPARATAISLFAGWNAIADLWLFWAAPIAGAIIGGLFGRALQDE